MSFIREYESNPNSIPGSSDRPRPPQAPNIQEDEATSEEDQDSDGSHQRDHADEEEDSEGEASTTEDEEEESNQGEASTSEDEVKKKTMKNRTKVQMPENPRNVRRLRT